MSSVRTSRATPLNEEVITLPVPESQMPSISKIARQVVSPHCLTSGGSRSSDISPTSTAARAQQPSCNTYKIND